MLQAQSNMNRNRGKRNVISTFFANSFGLVPAEDMDKTVLFENALLSKEKEAERTINDTRSRVNDINMSVANMTDTLQRLQFGETAVMEEIKRILSAQLSDEEKLLNINTALKTVLKLTTQISTLVEEIGAIQTLIKDLRTTTSLALRGVVDLNLFEVDLLIKEIGSFMTDHLITDRVLCSFTEGDYKISYHVGLTDHPLTIYSVKTIPFRTDGSSFAQISPHPIVAISALFEYNFLGPIESDCRRSNGDYYCDAHRYPMYKMDTKDCTLNIIKNWIFSSEDNDYSTCLNDISTSNMQYPQEYNIRDGMIAIISQSDDIGTWRCPPNKEKETVAISKGYQLLPTRKAGCQLETTYTNIKMEAADSIIKGAEDLSALDVGKALENIDRHLDLQYAQKFEVANITNILKNMSTDMLKVNKEINGLNANQEIIKRLDRLEAFNPTEINFREQPTQSTLIILGWVVILGILIGCICAIPKLCCQVPCGFCWKVCCSCKRSRRSRSQTPPGTPRRRRKQDDENMTEMNRPLIGKFEPTEFGLDRLQNDRNWMITGGKLFFLTTTGEGLEYNLLNRSIMHNGEALVKDVLAPSSILARFIVKPITSGGRA